MMLISFMKSKATTQICSIAILCSFCFPIFRWHGFEMSGLNYILSDHLPSYKYILLAIPVSALLLFVGTADGKYLLGRRALSWTPLVGLILISIAIFTSGSSEDDIYENQNLFYNIDLGVWLLLLFSLLLVLIKNKKRKITQDFDE